MITPSILTVTFLLSLLPLSLQAGSDHHDDHENCQLIPENDLRFPSTFKSAGMGKAEFEMAIYEFHKIMAPMVEKSYQRELKVIGEWENERVNAFASRDKDRNPQIVITGGMARHPMMTRDAFYSILCHEMGHHFGGAPKMFRGATELRSWSSAEGQADYYAATKCMPYLLERLPARDEFVVLDRYKRDLLGQVCFSENCLIIAQAAERVAKIFYDIRPQGPRPDILSRDHTEVLRTDHGHPVPQCRLDTFISGANCPIDPSVVLDDLNPHLEKGACPTSPFRDGGRPTCWFHPDRF